MNLGMALSICAPYRKSAGGGTFDPATLPLTAFLRSYAGMPMTGVASAGSSGSNGASGPSVLGAGAAPDPAVTTLGGQGASDGRTNDVNGYGFYVLDGTFNTYVAPTVWCGWAVVDIANLTNFYMNLVEEMTVTNGAVFVQDDGAGNGDVYLSINGNPRASRTITTGKKLVTWRYDGVNAQIGVNEIPGASGGASSAAYATPFADLSAIVEAFGLQGAFVPGDGFWDGTAGELAMTDQVLSDADFTNVISYATSRYGL